MVKCPKPTTAQIKANLPQTSRPSNFAFDGSLLSWGQDHSKGKESGTLDAESEESELDSIIIDKRNPPTARDELVYFFISCFLDILLESWEGKPCVKTKVGTTLFVPNESEDFGEDLGPCESSLVSSTTDFLKELYQKRAFNLSKEKLSGSASNGQNIAQTASAIGRSRHVVRNYIHLGEHYGLKTYKKRKGSLTEREKG